MDAVPSVLLLLASSDAVALFLRSFLLVEEAVLFSSLSERGAGLVCLPLRAFSDWWLPLAAEPRRSFADEACEALSVDAVVTDVVLGS